MPIDLRMAVAKYYDLQFRPPDDIGFYQRRYRIRRPGLLELGCGTGRVLIPLAEHCAYIHGLDCSEAMLSLCREKLAAAAILAEKASVQWADISDFVLDQTFDLIIAPYRVLQNLATDSEVHGLFQCIRQHLSPTGKCILNVFKPNAERDSLLTEWCCQEEMFEWESVIDGDRVVCMFRRSRIEADPLVMYPEFRYRRFSGEELREEAVLKIPMRCYYPEEFLNLIQHHGFRLTGSWGGYADEPYGEGGELVVAFEKE